MFSALKFIADNAIWFYIVLCFSILFLVWQYQRARRARIESLFGLELEVARSRETLRRRLLLAAVALLISGVVFLNAIYPTLPPPEEPDVIEPTPDVFATPPPTYTSETPTPSPTPTSTLSPEDVTPAAPTEEVLTTPDSEETTPEATEFPESPLLPSAQCDITSPADGEQVSGMVTFIGTATSEQFSFYKIEAYGSQTSGVWASILPDVISTPVSDNVLGTFDFSSWTPGSYSIRVIVVDVTGNEIGSCYVSLTLVSP